MPLNPLIVRPQLQGLKSPRDFINDRLPLFIALGVAVLVLFVLVIRRQIVTARHRKARQRKLDAQVANTDGMSGPEFEQLVARLLKRDGYAKVRIPGGSGDVGADVIGTAPDVQKFLGTCFHEHDADHAWFVTTTKFSKAARGLGTRRGVQLVDRSALAEWMAAA